MADFKTSLVPLNGKNYSTWKLQCRMALVKDIACGTLLQELRLWQKVQTLMQERNLLRSDRALAIIILTRLYSTC